MMAKAKPEATVTVLVEGLLVQNFAKGKHTCLRCGTQDDDASLQPTVVAASYSS